MKVIVLGDMHIGARNASMIVANHQLKFFEEQLFPYMIKNKITQIIQTGDLFDTRKFTNHIVLNEWKRRFFDKLPGQIHVLLGNHDIATKNSVSINSPRILLSEYIDGGSGTLCLYEYPDVVKFGKLDVLMMPWICLENHVECETHLKESKALWCFGHFEIDGFEMHRGQAHTGGMTFENFKRFEQIVSGHFHTRSENKNIKYVGTPYEMTWVDFDDPKGFHLFDTQKRELEFIKNELTLFNKIHYDDKDKGPEYYKGFDLSGIENTYVKIIVVNKTDPYQFDRLIDRIYQIGVADLKFVEDMSDLEADNVSDDEIEMEDTLSLIDTYVESIEMELDKDKMKKMLNTLYVEALEVLE